MNTEQGARNLQTTLDDLKRRLRQEREEAENLTHHLTAQREQNRAAEDTRLMKLESELAATLRQLADQKELTEALRQQLARRQMEARDRMRALEQDLGQAEERLREQRSLAETLVAERDAALLKIQQSPGESLQREVSALRAQLEEKEKERDFHQQQLGTERTRNQQEMANQDARARSLEEETAALRGRLESSQAVIEHLTAERDESRAQLAEVENRTRAVEEEFAAGQGQFREEREAAVQVIQQLEQEREQNRMRLSELEARSQWLEEELTAARDKLRSVPLTLMLVSTDLLAGQFQADPSMLESVRDIQLQSQKLLDEIRGPRIQTPVPEAMQPDGAVSEPGPQN